MDIINRLFEMDIQINFQKEQVINLYIKIE